MAQKYNVQGQNARLWVSSREQGGSRDTGHLTPHGDAESDAVSHRQRGNKPCLASPAPSCG